MNHDQQQVPQRLIYGCMGLGGEWSGSDYGTAQVDQAAAAIEAARQAGVALFDHADIYRSGKSEAVFGEVLAATPGLREKILLQTKCGIRHGGNGLPGRYDFSAENILARVGESLQRLRTDHVDILLLHRPDPLMDVRELATTVAQLMAEGKVLALGVSNMSAAQIAFLEDRLETPVVANQLEMGLGNRAWVESSVLVNRGEGLDAGFPHGTLEYAATHGVELQAYGSLAQGRYTGRPPGGPDDAATSALVESLAAEHKTTREAVVLGWLMKHPARISPVIGTTDPARIAACADAARVAAAMTRTEWYGLWVAARGAELP